MALPPAVLDRAGKHGVPGLVITVTAQEYFDFATNGKWATRISLFGTPGC